MEAGGGLTGETFEADGGAIMSCVEVAGLPPAPASEGRG